MSLASDINEALNVSGVTDLVGEHIYPVLAPQAKISDYLVWRRDGGDPLATLGANAKNREIVQIEVNCYGRTFDAADGLQEAVRDALNTGTSRIKASTMRPPIDLFDPDTRLFRCVLLAALFHRI